MGAIVKALGSLIGLGSTPKVDTGPATSEVDTEAAKSKAARAALLETAGGSAGATLQPGQVSPTQTLFGN